MRTSEILHGKKLLTLLIVGLLVKSCVFLLAVQNFPSELYKLGYLKAPSILEGYGDFNYFYAPNALNFVAGQIPYKDFFYSYPPLFLYLLVPFAPLPLPNWKIGIPIFLFDWLTLIPVYLTASKLLEEKRAFAVSLAFAIAPVNLWYSDFVWLNTPLTTFFTIVSAYFFISERHRLSSFALALATACKQTAIVLFPVMLFAIKKKPKKEKLIFSFIYLATFLALSLPYIILYPRLYLWLLGVPGVGPPSPLPAYVTWMQNTTMSGEWTYWPGWPTNLATFTRVLKQDAVYFAAENSLRLIIILSYLILFWKVFKKEKIENNEAVSYLLLAQLVFLSFFPRGIYKYYFVTVTPLLALTLNGNRRSLLSFMGFNLVVLFISRLLTPYLALFPMLWLTRKQLKETLSRLARLLKGNRNK